MITGLEKVNEDKWPRSTHKALNKLVDLLKRELKIQMVSATEAAVVEQTNRTVTWKIPASGGLGDGVLTEYQKCLAGSPVTVYLAEYPAP